MAQVYFTIFEPVTFKKTVIERKKKGFPVPLDLWFKGDFVDYAKKILLKKNAKINSIINQKRLEEWIDKNINENKDEQFGQKLWMILNVEIWMKKYF